MKIKKLYRFLRYNRHKFLIFKCLLYNAYYKAKIQFVPMNKLEHKLGRKGKESQQDMPVEKIRVVYMLAYYVNRTTDKMPWHKKCFARALTLQRLLKEQGISSTLYMGVGKEDGKMVAHAWLRCGTYYLTGGDGTGFAKVASYSA